MCFIVIHVVPKSRSESSEVKVTANSVDRNIFTIDPESATLNIPYIFRTGFNLTLHLLMKERNGLRADSYACIGHGHSRRGRLGSHGLIPYRIIIAPTGTLLNYTQELPLTKTDMYVPPLHSPLNIDSDIY